MKEAYTDYYIVQNTRDQAASRGRPQNRACFRRGVLWQL